MNYMFVWRAKLTVSREKPVEDKLLKNVEQVRTSGVGYLVHGKCVMCWDFTCVKCVMC